MSTTSVARGSRYDDNFILNVSSAAKIERIVDKVRSLASDRFEPGDLSSGWFRRIVSKERSNDAEQESDVRLPFFPFRVLLITGTAGAGKTSSIQTLAANLNCVITGTTSIAAQNLSSVLNRTRSAQVHTIYRAFGFNSKHVSMTDGASSQSERHRYRIVSAESGVSDIGTQQIADLELYWGVVEDIVTTYLDALERRGRNDLPEMCDSNIIVIDECGVLLRHMLHTVIFFYYFYNAVHDTVFYRERRVPCIVCVGSPTQTEALETSYDHSGGTKRVRRGMDVLSALISDRVLASYCRIFENWVMFINNKRCSDLDFSDLLKHIEFGLPLRNEHIEYVDRFVRPAGLIRDPAYWLDATRLFLSHAEVQSHFVRLHDQMRLHDHERLFDLPVYCVVYNKSFQEYCDIAEVDVGQRRPDIWFRQNMARIINYSQFVDHHISADLDVEVIEDQEGGAGETLITARVTYIRESSVGVTAKARACVVGYSGTFERFVSILQQDTFIDRTPCEQAVYAYSLLTGILYSAMYLFYSSKCVTPAALTEMARQKLPFVPLLASSEAGESDSNAWEQDTVYEDANVDVSDAELIQSTEAYTDRFFLRYAKPPPASCVSFEDVVTIYTVFRDIFIQRYQILQRHSQGQFGVTEMVTYNRRNVARSGNCEIVSHAGSFVGMLTHTSPVSGYALEGYTRDNVLTLGFDSRKIHPRVLEHGLCRLVVRDPLGFICILEPNVSRFVDTVGGKSLHICTTIDYGISSRTAMTIAKSQGLSLERVAIDFGDNPRNLRLSQIYVAMSRVVDPDKLVMNLNPMRVPYERNTRITPYICHALKNDKTTLIF